MLHEACRMQLGQAAPVEGILEHMSRDSGIVVPKRTCFHLHGTASSQVAVARVSAVEHLDSLGHTLGEEDVAGDLERVVENLLEASGGPISRALGTDTFDESALDPIAESPCFNVDVGNDLAFKEVLSRARSVRHPQQTDATLVSMGVFPLLKSLLPVVVAFLLPTTDTLDHRRVGNGTHRHGLFQEPMEELPAMA